MQTKIARGRPSNSAGAPEGVAIDGNRNRTPVRIPPARVLPARLSLPLPAYP
jgi:hypothetical protein